MSGLPFPDMTHFFRNLVLTFLGFLLAGITIGIGIGWCIWA